MEKKNIGLGVAALAAGAGAVALAAKNHKDNVKNEVKQWTAVIIAGETEHRLEPAHKRAAHCGCPFADAVSAHAPDDTCADRLRRCFSFVKTSQKRKGG